MISRQIKNILLQEMRLIIAEKSYCNKQKSLTVSVRLFKVQSVFIICSDTLLWGCCAFRYLYLPR